MRFRSAILAGGAAALLTPAVMAQVVINEFVNDDVGSDSAEFIELYNAGTEAVDISGWKLSRGSTSVGGTYTVPADTILGAGEYYLIGTASSAGVPGEIDGSLPGNPANTNVSFLTLSNASNEIVDSVVYNRSGSANIVAGHGEPPYGPGQPGGGIRAILVTSEYRNSDGQGLHFDGNPNASFSYQRSPVAGQVDSNNNERDFHLAIATPKAPNFSHGSVTPAQVAAGLTFDFSDADGTAVTDLPGGFSSVTCHDPTVADTMPPANNYSSFNPNAIPEAPAPGGGNVGICWANVNTAQSGLGNAAILNLTEPISDVEAEALVYIGAALSGTQYEMGDYFVLRGRPDPFHFYGDNPLSPNMPGGTNPSANGDVGVRLRFENNVGGSGKVNLYVDQRIDGETTAFAGPITITTPGWYRVALSVKDDKVAAFIGGQFGNYEPNGTLSGGIRLPGSGFYTTTIDTPGGVGMNYHTKASPASFTPIRPLTYDHLTFRAPTLESWAEQTSARDWQLFE